MDNQNIQDDDIIPLYIYNISNTTSNTISNIISNTTFNISIWTVLFVLYQILYFIVCGILFKYLISYITHFLENKVQKKFIIVDGLIGAGKTTLIKLLAMNMNACGYRTKAILEPVDVWKQTGALEMFYSDIPKHCYEFQTFTLITRIQRLLQKINMNDKTEYYLIERSPMTDKYVFVEMMKDIMGPIRMKMYNTWWNMWSSMIPFKPTLYVYLDTNIDDAINRLVERARSGEIVSNEYQTQLQKQHHNFYNNVLEKRYNYNNLVINEELMAPDFRNNYRHNNINVIREMIFSKLNVV